MLFCLIVDLIRDGNYYQMTSPEVPPGNLVGEDSGGDKKMCIIGHPMRQIIHESYQGKKKFILLLLLRPILATPTTFSVRIRSEK